MESIMHDFNKNKPTPLSYDSVPIIDISALASNSSEQERLNLAQVFENVYTNIGFAYIVNHGISQQEIDDIFQQARLFHALPESEKNLIKQNKYARGYVPMGNSTLKLSTLGSAKTANQSAGFILGPEISEKDYGKTNFHGPNQWPKEKLLPEFRTVLVEYNQKLISLIQDLIRVFSWVLCKNHTRLDNYFANPTTFLRLQYYPAQPDIIPEHQYGMPPHTDYGALTLLAQDNVGGLQVKQPNGTWLDVSPIPGAFILNTGDMMRRISNNRLIATPHRVINISGKERYSIPFFFEPDLEAQITPVISQNEQSLYEPITYGDYLLERFQNNYRVESNG